MKRMKVNNNYQRIIILCLLAFVILMLGNNFLTLTNPDEVFYAGTAKEMIRQHTWSVPYLFGEPQFEKPIFTYWLLRIGFLMFGVSSFGARFFPALFAILGVLVVYILCSRVYADKAKSFLCAFVLMTSGLYVGLARTVFTDMIFSVFILLSLASFYFGYHDRKWKSLGIVFFFVFSAFAVLTKGPLGFIIPVLIVWIFLTVRRELTFLFCRASFLGAGLFLLIAVPWYWFIISRFGNDFIKEFFYNDHIRRLLVAEHKSNDKWYFYPFSMALCMFPWSIFTAASFIYLLKKFKNKTAQPMHLFLLCWVTAVFAVFQIAHSKLISYVMPLFPALAMITGDFIHEIASAAKRQLLAISLATLAIFILLALGLGVASFKYSMYVSQPALLYGFIAFFIAVIIAQMAIIRKNPVFSPYASALNIFLLVFFIFFYRANFEEYVSSAHSSEYLQKNYATDGIILCSKSFARGVRFYTGKEIAIFRNGKGNFFSPHPVPFLGTNEEVRGFLANQPITYCVLDKSSLVNIEEVAGDRFKCSLLKNFGDEYIVLIKPNI